MAILITVAATVSAAVHVLFFYWESVVWSRPSTWRRFGVATQEQADATKAFAYNQGFYNLFLAVGAVLGSILYGVGFSDAGFALGLFSVVCMLAAAIVLMSSGRGRVAAALIQGTAPLITVVLYLVSLATGA